VAKYQSPSGKKIEDEAVTPNVVISENIDQLLEQGENPTPATPRTDDQLNKALSILKQKNA